MSKNLQPDTCDCVNGASDSGRCPEHGFGERIYRETAEYQRSWRIRQAQREARLAAQRQDGDGR